MGIVWNELPYNSSNTSVLEVNEDKALLHTLKDGRSEFIVCSSFERSYYSGSLGYESVCYSWSKCRRYESAPEATDYWKQVTNLR